MLQITTNNINLCVEFVDAPLDSLHSRRLEVEKKGAQDGDM